MSLICETHKQTVLSSSRECMYSWKCVTRTCLQTRSHLRQDWTKLFSLQYIEDYWQLSETVANSVHTTDKTRQDSLAQSVWAVWPRRKDISKYMSKCMFDVYTVWSGGGLQLFERSKPPATSRQDIVPSSWTAGRSFQQTPTGGDTTVIQRRQQTKSVKNTIIPVITDIVSFTADEVMSSLQWWANPNHHYLI